MDQTRAAAADRGRGPGLLLLTLRLAVPLYLANLALGLLPVGVVMLGLSALAGDRPWRADLLGAGWMNVVSEIVMTAYYARDLDGARFLRLAALVALPAAFLGQVAAYSFLAGGILDRLRSGDRAAPSFWTECRRWFGPFLRLTVLGGALVIAAAVLLWTVMSFVRPAVGQNLSAILQHAVVSAIAQHALLSILLGWLELARASMVVGHQGSAARALWRAGRAMIRPKILAVWLLLSLPVVGLLLAAILAPPVGDPYAVPGLLVALAYGQLLAFLGAWTKVVRLAVATRIAATALTSAPDPHPSAPPARSVTSRASAPPDSI